MSDLRSKTCCFSGHRNIPEAAKPHVLKRAEERIRYLYRKGVRYFGVGGAVGFDTWMAQLLFKLRTEALKDIKVILVFPYDGFTSRWNDAQKALYWNLILQYDKVVCSSNRPGREAYLERDRHLVDASSYCIAYCTRATGGTAYTVRYAQQQGLEVYNLAL